MDIPVNLYQPFDYVVIGAGTAGPVVASRISENPNVTVAILEAGGENTNDMSRMAGAFPRVWRTDYDWQYNTVEQPGLNNRTIYHPRGRVVGGSSAINIGAWLRGVAQDYEWEDVGAIGWNWNEARELFTNVIEDTDRGPTDYRGSGGKIFMRDSGQVGDVTDKLVDSFVEVGFGGRADISGPDPYNASRMQVIYQDHRRHTPADAYLSPDVRKRDNLTVLTNAYVTRILFDGKRATAVEYMQDGRLHIMPVNKEVILSAGTYNTPKILKLSGVGPEQELNKHGIEVVQDVPGVGENLSDHVFVHFRVLAPQGMEYGMPMSETMSDPAVAQWRKDRTGPANYFTENTVGLIALDENPEKPDFELIFGFNHGASSDLAEFKDIDSINDRSGYSIGVALLHPFSRGNVLLASNDPMDKPVINPNYLDDKRDVDTLKRGVRKVMKIFDAKAIEPYTDVIRISPESSDAQIEEFIRDDASTVFHPVGTARIGDLNDPMTVVDSNLRVRGLDNVRVADASIMPFLNSGHTMAPTVYIGEMAAKRIKKDME